MIRIQPAWLKAKRRTVTEALAARERGAGRHSIGRTATYSSSRDEHDLSKNLLLRDVAFNRHSINDGQHVSPYDNGHIQIGADGIEIKLVQGIDVPQMKRTLSMTNRATTGIDLSLPLPGDWEPCAVHEIVGVDGARSCSHKQHEWRSAAVEGAGHWVGQVDGDDWEEMLKGGLQTALESQVIIFAVSGVSRACTHQIVRTRKAAFHQQSQRASYYGDRPEVRMPESIWRNPRARASFLAAIEASHDAYRVACEEDVSYQDARLALLEGTTNYIMMEYSLREFLNVYAYRACSMFNWEIVHVMRECRRILVAEYPWLEPYIKISCEKTKGAKVKDNSLEAQRQGDPAINAHTCTFQGWERVEGQCDFPWARDSNRTFRSEAHEIGGRKSLGVEPK